MTAQRIFYVAGVIGSIILLCFLIWQMSEAAPPYPPKIQKLIAQTDAAIVCETKSPRRVGTIAYAKQEEPWLIRIFTKDGQELEIWFNESTSFFSLFFPDKIYYYTNDQWLDQDTLPLEEAKQLDRRLKFTGEEKQFFKECFEQKRNAAP